MLLAYQKSHSVVPAVGGGSKIEGHWNAELPVQKHFERMLDLLGSTQSIMHVGHIPVAVQAGLLAAVIPVLNTFNDDACFIRRQTFVIEVLQI